MLAGVPVPFVAMSFVAVPFVVMLGRAMVVPRLFWPTGKGKRQRKGKEQYED
jgi:hypothetical protein